MGIVLPLTPHHNVKVHQPQMRVHRSAGPGETPPDNIESPLLPPSERLHSV